ncbi:TetR/AcrR family transcriptional regulator [Myxococcus sp. K15C18031901]|nr:TetR/AcrR family transcriptional regulator [Myxococcus dinghuensis]
MLREDGRFQFTLREVARRAEVSHAAPYNHFPDKSALLAELGMVGFDRLREALVASRPKKVPTLREEFVEMSRAYVSFGVENPALYRLMFSPDVGSDVHLSERAVSAFRVLVELLERGQQDGVVRKGAARTLSAACWAQVHGITMLTIDGLFMPETVGAGALETALAVLFEGLER